MKTPQQARYSLHYRLIQKFDPSRFPRMSGVPAALVLDTVKVSPLLDKVWDGGPNGALEKGASAATQAGKIRVLPGM